MSKSIETARSNFDRALKNPDNLLTVADEHRWRAGFPAKQRTMYEATVAMTVAGWQAFIQELAAAIFEETASPTKASNAKLHKISAAFVERELAALNTPNSENVRNLLIAVGFDLGQTWTIDVTKPAAYTYSSAQAATILNLWVQVRHSVAHGFPLEKSKKLSAQAASGKMRVVRGMRPAGKGKSAMAVSRDDAEACVHFFKQLGDVVTREAAAYCLTP